MRLSAIRHRQPHPETIEDQDEVLSAFAAVADPCDTSDAVTAAGMRRDAELARMSRAEVVEWAVACADLTRTERDRVVREAVG